MPREPPDPVYTFRKHMAQINGVVLNVENGKELLFAVTSEGIVHMWDLKTKRELGCEKVSDDSCISIVRYNDRFVTQDKLGNIKFWKVENLKWHLESVVNIDYYGFCQILVWNEEVIVPSINSIVRISNENKKSQICVTDSDKRGEIMCIKAVLEIQGLLVVYESGLLALWICNDTKNNLLFEEKFTDDTPMCLDFCERTKECVLGTSGKFLKKISLKDDNKLIETGSTTMTNPGVASLAINSDGKLCVVGCWDGRIRYFSMKHLKVLAVLDHHRDGPVHCLHISEQILSSCPLGSVFAGGRDGQISLWDLYTNRRTAN